MLFQVSSLLVSSIQPSANTVMPLTTLPTTQVGHYDASLLRSNITTVTKVTNNCCNSSLLLSFSLNSYIRYSRLIEQPSLPIISALAWWMCRLQRWLSWAGFMQHDETSSFKKRRTRLFNPPLSAVCSGEWNTANDCFWLGRFWLTR